MLQIPLLKGQQNIATTARVGATRMRGGIAVTCLWATIAFIAVYCAYFSLAVARPRPAPLPDVAQLIARRRRRMIASASGSAPHASTSTTTNTTARAATSAAAAAATALAEGFPTKLLTQADVLNRVPEGGVAFFTLANTAYGDLAVNSFAHPNPNPNRNHIPNLAR